MMDNRVIGALMRLAGLDIERMHRKVGGRC